jgi:hypothetical protein
MRTRKTALSYLWALTVCLCAHSSLAQVDERGPLLGRWGLVTVGGGGSPNEITNYPPGERQQIEIALDRIVVWGPQPWGDALPGRVTIPIYWEGAKIVYERPGDGPVWPFGTGCEPIVSVLVTEVTIDPYGVCCTEPPWLILSLNYACPDAGEYVYTRATGG